MRERFSKRRVNSARHTGSNPGQPQEGSTVPLHMNDHDNEGGASAAEAAMAHQADLAAEGRHGVDSKRYETYPGVFADTPPLRDSRPSGALERNVTRTVERSFSSISSELENGHQFTADSTIMLSGLGRMIFDSTFERHEIGGLAMWQTRAAPGRERSEGLPLHAHRGGAHAVVNDGYRNTDHPPISMCPSVGGTPQEAVLVARTWRSKRPEGDALRW